MLRLQKFFLSLMLLPLPLHAVFDWFKKKEAPPAGRVEAAAPNVQQTVQDIKTDLNKLRAAVAGALDKNSFAATDVSKTSAHLKQKLALLPQQLVAADPATKDELQETMNILSLTAQALLEEAGVLALWMQGYEAYERDLNDNFKKLPNNALAKPDNKELYETLGFKKGEGQKKSFNAVRQQYKQRFSELQKKDPAQFDELYFRPYLRVLDYIFKTPYSKVQYDAYLSGKAAYDKKMQALKANREQIRKLFEEDATTALSSLTMAKSELN